MSEYMNKMIDVASKPPVKPKLQEPETTPELTSFVASAVAVTESDAVSSQVTSEAISEVIAREERAGSTEGAIARAVLNFASTIENPHTQRPTVHTDLLPAHHPLSTAWISVFRVRKATARYIASTIDDHEMSTLVASAIEAEPTSARRKFFIEVLKNKTNNPSVLADITFADEIIARKSK